MYFPKIAIVAMLGFLALAVMPFFLIRLVVFILIIRFIMGMLFRHRFHRRFGYHPHYLPEGPEPLEAGNYRFYARRFERAKEEDRTPTYRERDLV